MRSSVERASVVFLRSSAAKQLFAMAWPLVFGLAAAMSSTVVDSIYLARTGTRPLALYTSNVPLFSLLTYAAAGLGVATTAVLAPALGRRDAGVATSVASHAFTLGLVVIAILGALVSSMYRWWAPALGIPDSNVEQCGRFIRIWIVGEVFQAICVIGAGALKAYGDTRRPAALMAISVFTRLAVEFGIGARLDLGANSALSLVAWTNVGAWLVSAVGILYVTYSIPTPQQRLRIAERQVYGDLLRVAAPMAINTLCVPLSLGAVTTVVAHHGAAALAGFGLATRIEAMSLVLVQAISYGALALMGRAFGAGDRTALRSFARVGSGWLVGWGTLCAIGFAIFGGWIARSFLPDPVAADYLSLYLLVVPSSFAFFGLYHLATSTFLSTGRVGMASVAYLVRYVVVLVPAIILFDRLGGVRGIFIAIAVTNVIAGISMVCIAMLSLERGARELEGGTVATGLVRPTIGLVRDTRTQQLER